VQKLYRQPLLIGFLCPLLLYWISRVWLFAHRGNMPDDPVIFALTDGISRRLVLIGWSLSGARYDLRSPTRFLGAFTRRRGSTVWPCDRSPIRFHPSRSRPYPSATGAAMAMCV